MSFSPEAYRAIAAFMGQVDKITSINVLSDSLKKPLSLLGVKHLLCISAFGMPALQDRKLMFGFLHNDWITHYAKNHYYVDDALPNHALKLKDWGEPFWWSEFVATQDLTKTQRKIFEEAFRYGLKEGVVIPLPVRVNDETDEVLEYAYVSAGGELHRSDELENVIRLLSVAAHRTARRIYLKDAKGGFARDIVQVGPNMDFSTLTAREREILAWIIEGKQPSEVADILDIKRTTVVTHLRNIKRRYGFGSTTEMITALHRHKVFI
ncbi:helix-turn-helix transcriptional regulator [Kordiimonas lipolytica]|uniref:Helix-turn-helix transcriptional regulator n=1 Tax=Kordiimonas lipolytica TaxID=1662421 RepID=A0ABV8U836_9PROT|nr:LuxR C-terminal-related transcriptional regulator [Kordiimonas lipolytica]